MKVELDQKIINQAFTAITLQMKGSKDTVEARSREVERLTALVGELVISKLQKEFYNKKLLR